MGETTKRTNVTRIKIPSFDKKTLEPEFNQSTGPLTADELALLADLCEHASVGPWGACHNGECKCKSVSNDNHPVASVTAGKWGDDYPSIRLTGPSLDLKAEAFMDQITYGEVAEEQAKANARLIAASRTVIPRLMADLAAAVARAEQAERERDAFRDVVKNGYELSKYAAAINWDGRKNTRQWLNGLRERIEYFQLAVQEVLSKTEVKP